MSSYSCSYRTPCSASSGRTDSRQIRMASHYHALLANDASIASLSMSLAFCVKYGDASVTVNAADAVSLVVNLSEGHGVTRRTGSILEEGRPRFGAVTVVPPGDETTFRLRGTARVLLMQLPWAAVTRVVAEEHERDPDRTWIRPRFTDLDLPLSRIVFQMVDRLGCTNEIISSLVAGLLNDSDCHQAFGRSLRRRGLTALQLQRVSERIEEDDSSLQLESLAAETGLSLFHFAREFRHTTGLAPHRYVLHRRLARAVKLLAEPRRRVADIAAEAGFSHASHLSRHMRQATGMSPDMFRDRLLSRL